jgi:hypothetical protein
MRGIVPYLVRSATIMARIKNFIALIQDRMAASPAAATIIAFMLIVILGIIDYITGYEFNIFVFYYFPISLAGWYAGRKQAVVFSILSAITWSSVDYLSRHAYPHWLYYLWNGGIRLASFLVLAIMLAALKNLLGVEKKLSQSLRAALGEVKLLEGFLPICSSCKKIRNDRGNWEQMEQYISGRSQAEFTHTLCPECMEKLYPEMKDEK